MAPNAVLGNIAALVNAIVYENSGSEATYEEWAASANLLTVDEIIGLVADFTGATLNEGNAYANMEVSASGYWQDGIGASVSAVLGGDDATGEIKLAISANRIANNPEIEAIEYMEYVGSAIVGNEIITVSNNTGVDGGARLLNAVKKIFNSIITDEQFHLDTFEEIWGEVLPEDTTGIENGTFYYEEDGTGASIALSATAAPEGYVVYVTNMLNGVSVNGIEFNGEYDQIAINVEGSEGITITVLGNANTVVGFSFYAEAPETGDDDEPVGPGTEETFTAIELTEAGTYTTDAFVAGTSLADPGIQSYNYSYTATADCTVTFASTDADITILTVNNGQVFGGELVEDFATFEAELEAGETIYFSVSNANWELTAVSFTIAIA